TVGSLFEPGFLATAPSGITTAASATSMIGNPRPPRPHRAFARLPPRPQSAFLRESSRGPEPHSALVRVSPRDVFDRVTGMSLPLSSAHWRGPQFHSAS